MLRFGTIVRLDTKRGLETIELLALHEADYLGFVRVESAPWRAVFDAVEDELRCQGVNVSRKQPSFFAGVKS